MRPFPALFLLLLLAQAGFCRLPVNYPDQSRLLFQLNLERPVNTDSLLRLAQAEHNPLMEHTLELLRLRQRFPTEGRKSEALASDLRRYIGVAADRGETGLAISAQVLLARYYWDVHERAAAFELALQAHELYRNLSGSDYPPKYGALYELGSFFYEYRDFSTARRYFDEALAVTNGIEIVGRNNIVNTIGLCYRNEGRYEQAAACFARALALTPENDGIWKSIIGGNLGITYFLQGRYGEAVPLLQEDIDRSLNHNAALDNAVHSMAILGRIFTAQRRIGEATSLLEQAERITVQENGFHQNYRILGALYRSRAGLADAAGNPREAARYWQATALADDSLFNQINAVVLARAQLKVSAERSALERQRLEGDLRVQRLTRNALLAGILLLAAIGVLLLRQQRSRHQLRQQQSAAELETATAQLEAFARAIHEKNELIDRFGARLYAGLPATTQADDPEAIAELRSLTILTDEEWARFQESFNKVYPGYFERLTEKLPGLTAGDIRYVALLKLQLNNKEIGGVLGIGPGSVRSIRSRLRKKLGLSEEDALEAVIGAI